MVDKRLAPSAKGKNPFRPLRGNPALQADFLDALARLGQLKAAAAEVGVGMREVHECRRSEPEFALGIDRAEGMLQGELLETARMLAIDGAPEYIRDKEGNVVHEKRRYSERLLLQWLKRFYPEDWGDKVRVDQKVEGEVRHQHSGRVEVEKLTPEQRRLARAFVDSLRDPGIEN